MADILSFPNADKEAAFKAKILKELNAQIDSFTEHNATAIIANSAPLSQAKRLMLAGAAVAMFVLDEDILADLFVEELRKDDN